MAMQYPRILLTGLMSSLCSKGTQDEANVGKRHLKNEKLGSTDPKSDEANECLLVKQMISIINTTRRRNSGKPFLA